MPLHDWGQASDADFHSFLHHGWIWNLMKYLNKGVLPKRYVAMAERYVGSYIADVVAMEETAGAGGAPLFQPQEFSPTAVMAAPVCALLAKQINLYDQELSRVVAVIEIISPGNKNAREKVDSLVNKSLDYLSSGIHLLLIDILPATAHVDSFARNIVNALHGPRLVTPKPLFTASFQAGQPIALYLECFTVGDTLPKLPLFLSGRDYVTVNLEQSYAATLDEIPESKIPSCRRSPL
jgi:hypothetical protein